MILVLRTGRSGLKMFATVKDCVEIPESKGGGKTGMHFLEGVYSDNQ